MAVRQYVNALVAAVPFVASAAVADLAPWQVTSINTFSPSGRPGSDPTWFEFANITNPDPTQTETDPAITQGTVSCHITWLYPNVPYNQIFDCDVVDTVAPVSWAWTVELLAGSSNAINNFTLQWRAASTIPSEEVQVYTGTGHFEVVENLFYSCGGSGSCSASLNTTPFLVDVSTVSCNGTVEEALYGIDCE